MGQVSSRWSLRRQQPAGCSAAGGVRAEVGAGAAGRAGHRGPRAPRAWPSARMICSEAELEIVADDSGILVLPESWRAGDRLVGPRALDRRHGPRARGRTPNRPDALGHLGVARDVGAPSSIARRGRRTCDRPDAANTREAGDRSPRPSAAGRYLGYVLEGMSVQLLPASGCGSGAPASACGRS